MFEFDFTKFLIDKRLTLADLAKKTGISYNTLYNNSKENKIKAKNLRILEEIFNNLSEYLLTMKENESI